MAAPITVEVEGRGPKPESVEYPSTLQAQPSVEVPSMPHECETSPPAFAPEPPAVPEVQEQPPPPPPAPHLFLVSLDTRSGGKLGFGVGHKPGEMTLHVVKLQDVGLVPDWNRAHPDKQVSVGSRIHEINGKKVEPKEQELMMKDIADACSKPQVTFLVERLVQLQ
eukprot:5220123-Amphidinium_carterae.2